MPFRVTDASTSARLAAQIAAGQQRVAAAQERVSSGRRINRPSDDPNGAAAVVRLRNSQATIESFRRNAGAAKEALMSNDAALDAYELTLDRAGALLTQGATGTTKPEGRAAIAAELDALRTRMIAVANTSRGEEGYVFGGTRQNAPPFDPMTGAAAAGQTSAQLMQVEPGTLALAVGVTADAVFSDSNGTVFEALAAASAALRGTGDEAADALAVRDALDRLKTFGTAAQVARSRVGSNLNTVEQAAERLGRDSLSLEESAGRVETADFVESALQLTEAQRALEAALQATANTRRRSLIDFLG